jgi:Diguanylate cyclase, GGDEF domain
VAVGRRLGGALRPSDTLGRLGGDEFLVVCEDIGGDGDALAVAHRLERVFQPPFRLAGLDVTVAASIGLAVSRPDSDPAALVGEADAAMYVSKSARPRTPVLFEEWMRPTPGGGTVPGQPPESSGGDRPEPSPLGGQLSGLVARLVGMLEDLGESGEPGGDPD